MHQRSIQRKNESLNSLNPDRAVEESTPRHTEFVAGTCCARYKLLIYLLHSQLQVWAIIWLHFSASGSVAIAYHKDG